MKLQEIINSEKEKSTAENSLRKFEEEIITSLTKVEKIRPWRECLSSGVCTALYPLSVVAAGVYFFKAKYPFEGLAVLTGAVTSPVNFVATLVATIFPFTSRKVANKSLLSKKQSDYSICVGVSDSVSEKYGNQNIRICLPNEQNGWRYDYFYDIGKERFEKYKSLK